MVAKCTSWLGHKFEARYSYSPPGRIKTGDGYYADDVVAIIEACRTKTYERDVCVRCGATIERAIENHPAEGGDESQKAVR